MDGFPLDRKQMEQERLARIAVRNNKRERSISPPAIRSPRKAPKLQQDIITLPSGARLNSIYTSSSEPTSQPTVPTGTVKLENASETKESPLANATAKSTQRKSSKIDPALKYPHGVVKKTWAFGHDRVNDIKIEEVLEPLTLKIAVLSAFKWDMEWVLAKLRTPLEGGHTKCIFVMEGKERELRQQILSDISEQSSWLQVCFPPMDGAFCMHSKLMLLFHPTKLRVAIPTANLLDFDWGETGMMENSVFIIDLPRLPEQVTQLVTDMTPFARELLHFVNRQGISQKVQDGLLNFDFGATADMAFVHSIGGSSVGQDAARTGLAGLSQAVRSLQLTSSGALELDFAASSIGSLKEDYLRTFHSAARGEDLILAQSTASSKAKASFFKKAAEKPRVEDVVKIKDKLRIYFPTKSTVQSSIAGTAGTICLQRKWFEADSFPSEIFRDYVSTRRGLLSHSKILCARGISANPAVNKEQSGVAWVYVGSANMSMSAWGTVAKDAKGKVSCRNWECGVLLPVVVPTFEASAATGSSNTQVKTEVNEAGSIAKKVLDASQTKPTTVVNDDDSETESEPSDTEGKTRSKSSISASKKPLPPVESGSETESDDAIDTPMSSQAARVTIAKTQAPTTAAVEAKIPDIAVFRSVIDLPFVVPGSPYNGEEPWYFME
jgi:hypothetical protein